MNAATDDESSSGGVVEQLADNAGDLTQEGDEWSAERGSETVTIPQDPDDPIVIDNGSITLGLELPTSIDLEPGTESMDGVVEHVAMSADVAVHTQAEEAGGFRVLIEIAAPDSPTEYAFTADLPPNGVLEERSDGGISVRVDGQIVGSFAPPWAVDALGRQVPTTLTVSDGRLVQSVSHAGFAYPVVADPRFTWGIITGTIYFNRAETKTIANGGWGVATFTSVCGLAGAAAGGAVGAAAFAAACAAQFGAIVYTAGVANNSVPAKCLKVNSRGKPGTYGSKDSNGDYCK